MRTVRFDWTNPAAPPSVVATRTLAQASHGLVVSLQLGGIEYDLLTQSHWAIGYRDAMGTKVGRLGYSGGVVESQAAPALCDVAYTRDWVDGSFLLAYSTFTSQNVVRGDELGYPTDAISVAYGTGCAAPGVAVYTSRSFAGHEFYRVLLANLAPGTPAIYVLGSAPGSFDLTGSGLPGCFLNVALPALGTSAAIADSFGTAEVVYALPDAPVFLGDVFSQWFYFEPTAAPVPFRASSGVRHQVR